MMNRILFLLPFGLANEDYWSKKNLIYTTTTANLAAVDNLGKWEPSGISGVICIHTALLPDSKLLCLERPHMAPYPRNPNTGDLLSTQIDLKNTVNDDGSWSAKYTAIEISNNPFCAGHSLLADGSALVVGGDNQSISDAAGNINVVNGRRGLRTFTPCEIGSPASCLGTWKIFPDMTTERWYPTVVTLADGSAIIIGGQTKNIDFDRLTATDNNPTYEYFPSKSGDWPKQLEILQWSFPHNLYAPSFLLPSGNIFMIVSNKTIIINTKTEEVINLPDLVADDHSPWIYPHTPTMFILPITIANDFRFELMICGGSKLKTKDASATCYQIAPEDPNPEWMRAKDLPNARLMPDAVILPDGNILMVNGLSYGQAGGNQGQTQYARDPVYATDIFDGKEWKTLAPAKNKRLYHSGALLLESGHVVTVGSEMDNYEDFWPTPNSNCFEDVNNLNTNPTNRTGCRDPFNYNIERFTPPYLLTGQERLEVREAPKSATHGSVIRIAMKSTDTVAKVNFIRMASVTHSTNTDQRLVELVIVGNTRDALWVMLPSSPALAPPGNWFLWVLNQHSIPADAKTIKLTLGSAVNETIPAEAKPGAPATTVNRSGAPRSDTNFFILFLSFLVFMVSWLE